MRTLLVAVVVMAASAASTQHSLAHKQQVVNRLLYRVSNPIPSKFEELHQLARSWNPRDHLDHCKDGGQALTQLLKEMDEGRLRSKHRWFSLFNPRQRKEAIMLVKVLLNCHTFDTFMGHATFFRERMNEGEFVYALYAAVTHSDLTRYVILPPLYEVTPHMFTNSEVIQQAYFAKMTHTPGRFKMSFTGTLRNPEQRVAYFGEDIGLNSHHVHWHLDFPFWWDGEPIDRKGELFFYAHHQLSARFDSERLSNHLPIVDELYWDKPIKEGFSPHTVYQYGGEFPTRPDDKQFEDVPGVARVHDMMIIEERIRDAIAHGYIVARNGSHIRIDNERGIDLLGDIIESSTSSVNPQYYQALHNQAHVMLGRQSDPEGKFNMPPGVMEHFETATRDPAFFRLHKYMDNMFKEHKNTLRPYTRQELLYENVVITQVDTSPFVTYFEDFEIDLTNALDSAEGIEDVPVSAYVPRLNHEPYHFNISAHADHADTVSVRIYICPMFDHNGIMIPFDDNRWRCIEMDKFWTKVTAGDNLIQRSSDESSVGIPDRTPFATLMADADAAVSSGTDLPYDMSRARGCGHPQRLLLPKGKPGWGMSFWLFVGINNGEDGVYGELSEEQHGSNHPYCGVTGHRYPDRRPMGYPFDRPIEDIKRFLVPNLISRTIWIEHRQTP